jgi:anti-anti-sigma factor
MSASSFCSEQPAGVIRVVPETDEIVAVCLEGDFDLSNAPAFGKEVGRALENGNDLILDLSQATFIDSSVVHVLVNASKALVGSERAVVLQLGTAAIVERVLEIAEIERVLPRAHERREAVRMIQQASSSFSIRALRAGTCRWKHISFASLMGTPSFSPGRSSHRPATVSPDATPSGSWVESTWPERAGLWSSSCPPRCGATRVGRSRTSSYVRSRRVRLTRRRSGRRDRLPVSTSGAPARGSCSQSLTLPPDTRSDIVPRSRRATAVLAGTFPLPGRPPPSPK